MSFILAPVEKIKINCKIEIPGDFGKIAKSDIDVTWKYLSIDERQAFINRITDQENPPKDIELLKELILDIDGLKDDQKQDVEFSATILEQLAQLSYVRSPLMKQASEIIYGKDLAEQLRQKN